MEVVGDAFNVGGGPGNTVTFRDVVHLIESLERTSVTVRSVDRRPDDPRFYSSDVTAFSDATGWKPKVGVAEGIARLARWLRIRHPEHHATTSETTPSRSTSGANGRSKEVIP
jgi:CDP-paratose 2-epimerase